MKKQPIQDDENYYTHIFRSGNWNENVWISMVDLRTGGPSNIMASNIGFRVCRNSPKPYVDPHEGWRTLSKSEIESLGYNWDAFPFLTAKRQKR